MAIYLLKIKNNLPNLIFNKLTVSFHINFNLTELKKIA